MGLDTSHNCWHASYRSFAVWRNQIAAHLGDLGYLEADDDDGGYRIPPERIPDQGPAPDETRTDEDGETYTIHWSTAYGNSVYLGRWDTDPLDIIDVLMIHSDCEGIIEHRFTRRLAERLLGIHEMQSDGWQRDATARFATGLLDAYERDEDVDFH